MKKGGIAEKDISGRIALLAKLVALLPRGQGAIPRAIGKRFESLFADCYVFTRHGAKLVVTPSALDFFTTLAASDWAFDYWVLDTCADLMPRDGVFYDVGANVGYMSLEMTRRKPDCRLIASFEPQPELVRNLRRSFILNGISNLSIVEACVGDVSGEVSFASERHSIHAHVQYPDESRQEGEPAGGATPQIALDDLVARGDLLPPDVIKIDVEGYEYKVLRGARKVIETWQPHIVFELSDATPRFGYEPEAFFDLLSSLGDYRFEIAVGSYRDALVIDNLREFHRRFNAAPYQTNILARAKRRSSEQ